MIRWGFEAGSLPGWHEDLITGDGWSTDSPWHKVTVQLLTLSPVVNWDSILVKENVLVDTIYGENSNYKDSGIGWLLLSSIKALGEENEKLREWLAGN